MKITALGTGSAFTLKNYQTSYLIETDGRKLLFDCGGDARFSLNAQGLSYKDITDVYISHLHGDHVGGLEWLGFTKYFDPTQSRPRLYMSDVLVDDLWNKVLSGGMGSLQGRVASLEDYFEVMPIKQNGSFTIGGVRCSLVQTVHIMNGYYIVPSFGMIVTTGDNYHIFITGDTQFAPEQINSFYMMSDLIIHDTEYLYTPDGTPIYSTVHAHFERLKTLPDDVKSKMWLSHYQDTDFDKDLAAIYFGFKGFLKRGQVLEGFDKK